VRSVLLIVCLAACGVESARPGDPGGGKEDRGDAARVDVLATRVVLDIAGKKGVAIVHLMPDARGRASLDVHGLQVVGVDADHDVVDGRLELAGLSRPARVEVQYRFGLHEQSNGLMSSGVSVLWPYHCGNLLPCHPDPADGLRFEVELANVPAGQVGIFPPAIEVEAPIYMLAIAVGEYDYLHLGETRAGTRVGAFYLPRGKTAAVNGTRDLLAVFDWLEQTLGPYAFGPEVASVSAHWGGGALGGMEHHPYWHVADAAMDDPETHAHEAAHGWYGDGVRIRCWEDFVLSEGTTSYLAVRALGQVAGAEVEAAVWRDYAQRLEDAVPGHEQPAWPRGCGEIDILEDGLFSDIPYMRGAFFYRDVAEEIGAERLDEVLAGFYRARVGTAAGMQDMLDEIQQRTGFDPGPLAGRWLRAL
jgi:hypothetical protein